MGYNIDDMKVNHEENLKILFLSTVEWGKISPPFTFKCLYFRGVPLMKKIVLSKTCMNIGTNDSHITYSDVAIVSPVFFLICRVADL